MQINSSKRLTAFQTKKSEQVLNLLINNIIPAGFILASKSTASSNADISGAILTTKVDAASLNPGSNNISVRAKHIAAILKSRMQRMLIKYAELFGYDQDLEQNINVLQLSNNCYMIDISYNDVNHIQITAQNMPIFGVCITILIGFP